MKELRSRVNIAENCDVNIEVVAIDIYCCIYFISF